MKKKDSPFVALVREQYDPGGEMSYADECNLLLLLNGPAAYEVEDEMLQYAREHEKASVKELIDYFRKITPDGYPPGFDIEAFERECEEEEN